MRISNKVPNTAKRFRNRQGFDIYDQAGHMQLGSGKSRDCNKGAM